MPRNDNLYGLPRDLPAPVAMVPATTWQGKLCERRRSCGMVNAVRTINDGVAF